MSIRVEGKDNYEWTHGHKPKGRGSWGFKIANEEKFFNGTFSEAQTKAKAYARKNHPKVFSIKVLT
jgi:hypothetical protein